jgi:hypothetical protein
MCALVYLEKSRRFKREGVELMDIFEKDIEAALINDK